MKIGEISGITRISRDRIRNYESEKLIDVYTNSETGYRIYNENHIRQINFISQLQDIGLKMKEIKVIIDFSSRDYHSSIEQHLKKIGEIFNKYDSPNHTEKVHEILDDLMKMAYNKSEEEFKVITTPFATMVDENLKSDMYVETAKQYISKYMIELDLNPQEAYKYFSIVLNNERINKR